MLSKLKICNRNTFSSHQAPLANDHYGRTGRCEKWVFLSPVARTFILQTSSHTVYEAVCSYHGSRKHFTFPISSKLIDPECNKTMCPWCRACLKRDITTVRAALLLFSVQLILEFTILQWEQKMKKVCGFILHSKWGIPVINCGICFVKCFSSTSEEFRNTLSCNGTVAHI